MTWRTRKVIRSRHSRKRDIAYPDVSKDAIEQALLQERYVASVDRYEDDERNFFLTSDGTQVEVDEHLKTAQTILRHMGYPEPDVNSYRPVETLIKLGIIRLHIVPGQEMSIRLAERPTKDQMETIRTFHESGL